MARSNGIYGVHSRLYSLPLSIQVCNDWHEPFGYNIDPRKDHKSSSTSLGAHSASLKKTLGSPVA